MLLKRFFKRCLWSVPFFLRYRRTVLRLKSQKCLAAEVPLCLILGAGKTRYEGWIATDLPVFNIVKLDDWCNLFDTHSIDRMLAEHVFEHLRTEEFRQFLNIARDFLTPTGFIRIGVPDGYHPDPNYIDHVRPGGIGSGAEDHKVLYNRQSLSNILHDEGYEFCLLEYFDENGQFHQQEWSGSDGMIMRSADYDKRNQLKPLTYTSLIVDVWPTKGN